ncbi:MAG TPA: hypothetical protein VGM56_05150 [Byssovorax sp.]|jgi:hypothetical protein
MSGAAPRRLVLASPIEPSGASWILNVLLELGVRVRHRPVEKNVFRSAPRSMWLDDESGARLHPSCSQIEKWMPALTLRERFHFRDDVEVDYTQDLPPKGAPGDAELVFLRDPRDALLSAYKRAVPPIGYDGWLALPNPRTLLDRASNWALFARAWLARPGVGVARFEDYKADDRATFDAIARHLALDVDASDVPRALAASTFEKAREGELRYRAKHPEDAQIANRAGKVGESREAPELHAASQAIEARAADVLARLGYRAGSSLEPLPGAASFAWLAHFRGVALPPEAEALAARGPLVDPALPALLAFAREVDAAALERMGIGARDGRDLVDALAELTAAEAEAVRARLVALRGELADGSRFQLAELRALVAARRRAKAPPA